MEKYVASLPEFGKLFGAIITQPASIQDIRLGFKERELRAIV